MTKEKALSLAKFRNREELTDHQTSDLDKALKVLADIVEKYDNDICQFDHYMLNSNMKISEMSPIDIINMANTIHFNACVNSIEKCIKYWNIDTSNVVYPPHPTIDVIKKS
jgi:hypothetical protein